MFPCRLEPEIVVDAAVRKDTRVAKGGRWSWSPVTGS
jgi:hypothetical protein